MKRILICLLPILFLPDLLTAASFITTENRESADFLSGENSGRRRRRSGKGSSLLDDLEIFRHNADVFAGPAYHISSGDFFSNLDAFSQKNKNSSFFRDSVSYQTNFISATGGAQYRIIPNHKDRGFLSLISYAAGISIQRRGYSFSYESNIKNLPDSVSNSLTITEKVRATYVNIPLSARLGKRVFVEGGISLNFLLSGTSQVNMDRQQNVNGTKVVDNPVNATIEPRRSLGKVLPFVSPGLIFSAGMYFNENLGFRFCANLPGNFFKADSNPDKSNFKSTVLSLQLLGCIN